MAYGLIGEKLKHSYSKSIHNMLAEYDYDLYEIASTDLEAWVAKRALSGYNVTIPYKRDVMAYLDELDKKALAIGAVNTVVNRGGRLIGYNTDYDGMRYMLQRAGIDIAGKKVMILGTGGTSSTAQAVCRDMDAREIVVVSRIGTVNYTNCYEQLDTQVIINTTPVGMYPAVEASPINIALFPELLGVADVIYNPQCTVMIQDAKRLGIKHTSGLAMLVAQAKYAMELFRDVKVSDDVIEEVLYALNKRTKNIILIGMPGAGKSTVAQLVAERLDRAYVDIDAKIAERLNMTIPEIFATHGEAYFREVERTITQEYARESGLVIATGGGVVKTPANYTALHLNSVVIELYRPLELLPTDNRPLSIDLAQLYRERKSLYESFRDAIVAEDTLEKTIQGVIDAYENSCH